MTGIELRSGAFDDRATIPRRYTQDGAGVSPPLSWTGVPDGTTGLLLLCEDPDAPRGTFLHWLVTGIDPASAGVDEGGTPPAGRQWPNDAGGTGWVGPKPPAGHGPHRYFFRLYALPGPLRLPARPSADDVRRQAEATALASGVTVGVYER